MTENTEFVQSLYGNADSGTVLVQMVDDHDLAFIEKEIVHIEELTGSKDFLLAAIKVKNWNTDLSPWPAPPVFGEEAFGSGAAQTLQYLTEQLLPALGGGTPSSDRSFLLGGYSLAGLFALWSAYQTGLFSGVAAASPSVWFPGFGIPCVLEWNKGNHFKNPDLRTAKAFAWLLDRGLRQEENKDVLR